MLKIASCSSLRKRAKSLGTLETSDFRGFLSNTGLTFESFRPSQNTPVKSLRKLLRPLMPFLIPIPPSERPVFPNDTVSTKGRHRHESQSTEPHGFR